ncbi:MAG: hypothetical protein ACOYD3_07750 [Kiritimatiellia bacterium]|jgi:hypothetical protein
MLAGTRGRSRNLSRFFRLGTALSLCSRSLLLLLLLLLVGFALPLRADTTTTPPAVLQENLSWGSVEILLRAEPAEVRLEQDLNVVLTVTAPATQQVDLPDLRDRFQGFTVAEGFPRDPVTLPDGRRSREYRWRLVPGVACAEYRLAPFAVTVRDSAPGAVPERSFATRPVVFPAASRDTTVTGSVELDPKPFWIAPTRRMMFGILILACLAVVLVIFVVRLIGYLRHQVRLRRLAPDERAFYELERLLGRRLAEQGLFKDFYIELTQVVRRYIERTHGIRAPGQTTEEFLAAARNHPGFKPNVLERLRDFLQSADLVKFAGQSSNISVAEDAVRTARSYIEQDAAAVRQAAAEAGKGS